MNLGGRSDDNGSAGDAGTPSAVNGSNRFKSRSNSTSVKKRDSPIPTFQMQNLLSESDNPATGYNI